MEGKGKITRKSFIKTSGLGLAGIAVGLSAKSYANILGANDRIRFAVIGINGRGQAHIASINQLGNASIEYLSDVDSEVLKARMGQTEKLTGKAVKGEKDFRKVLENKDIDAISIATPNHWHTAMTIMGVKAGKHVYVEKPFAVTPEEGELLVKTQEAYPNLIMQMGNQQRSAITSIEAVKLIKGGIIGKAYYGKAWYANRRGTIGVGKEVSVPDRLDWELWQGPAPRTNYKDNIVHYNWHWFKNWGSGEVANNGLHEMDFCRWALGVDLPENASSSGGRYHFKDDWEFFDTQVVNYEYDSPEGKKMITWEGLSCNPHAFYGRSRGAMIRGTKGSMIVDRQGYEVYDMDNNLIRVKREPAPVKDTASSTRDTVGGGILTDNHFKNFVESIRGKETPHSPMDEGRKSNLLSDLGNIAQFTGRHLNIDSKTGKIIGDSEAEKYWSRTYDKNWDPRNL